MNNNKDFCKRVITFPQVGPTCWFNSLLMCILYSQNSRKLIMKLSKKWDTRIKIFKLLKTIIDKKYVKDKDLKSSYSYFNIVKPEYILNDLHQYNKKKFFNLELFKKGYMPEAYIRKLYKLLGASILLFDEYNNEIIYSEYNKFISFMRDDKLFTRSGIVSEFKLKQTLRKNLHPDVIVINHYDIEKEFNKYVPNYYNIIDNKDELLSHNDVIKYNNEEYILDSVILGNWNKKHIKNAAGHVISGITCKNERYIYNGWTRSTIDPAMMMFKTSIKSDDILNIPCELMKYSWNIKKDTDFCLSPDCYPTFIKDIIVDIVKNVDLCFSFNKPPIKLIYIKKIKKKIKYINRL